MRRKRTKTLSLTTAALIAIPLVIIAAVGWVALQGREMAFEGVPELRPADYLENANSLRGNTYRVTGTVEDNLRWNAGKGRLVSVLARDASGQPAEPLPIHIPPHINENVQTGQSFAFKVHVGQDGVLVAEDMKKN